MEPQVTISAPPLEARGAGFRAAAGGASPLHPAQAKVVARRQASPSAVRTAVQSPQDAEDALYDRLYPKDRPADAATSEEDALYARLFGAGGSVR
jgi:hypothetical protein